MYVKTMQHENCICSLVEGNKSVQDSTRLTACSYCDMPAGHATTQGLSRVERLGFRKVSYLKGEKAEPQAITNSERGSYVCS